MFLLFSKIKKYFSPQPTKQKVFVGLSGGVDSSVTAYLLQQAGYDVTGVFIRTWQPPELPCTWRAERRDAMRVAGHLGIPFLQCDMVETYKNEVADYMIREYKLGRTPNPDVFCNKEVKFGGFLRWALERGADFVATGHYAQNLVHNGVHVVAMSPDMSKDQSYFLWTLTDAQLQHILFPVGHMHKDAVRAIARTAGLPVADKKDSQGVCFIGQLDMKDFLRTYVGPDKEGSVTTVDGVVIGTHPGAHLFTLGERHGFTIIKKSSSDDRYYIVAKDLQTNTLIVSPDIESYAKEHTASRVALTDVQLSYEPQKNKVYQAVIRYHGKPMACTIESYTDTHAVLVFEHPDATLALGQSVVVYDEGRIMLAGIKE